MVAGLVDSFESMSEMLVRKGGERLGWPWGEG